MLKTETVVHVVPTLKIFKGHPSLVPYVGMFFILIIFFMIGSNFVPVKGAKVDLPAAVTKTTYASRSLIVSVDAESVIYFNEKPYAPDKMEDLKGAISSSIVQHDRRSSHREVLIVRADSAARLPVIISLLSIAEELNLNALFEVKEPAAVKKATFSERDR